MKSYKIVIFIFSIILALICLSFYFPRIENPTIGAITFHFPSFKDMTQKTKIHRKNMDEILRAMEEIRLEEEYHKLQMQIKDSTLMAIADSIEFYHSKIFHGTNKLYLPYNDMHFFDSLFAEMENSSGNKRIMRVLHYGDSQIETDRISSSIRTFFQKRFGGGGPGMIPLVQKIPASSVMQRVSGNVSEYAVYGNAEKLSDKNYGLMTKCHKINGTVNLSITPTSFKNVDEKLKQISSVSVLFKNNSGNFIATLSDKKTNYLASDTCKILGISTLSWTIDSTSSNLNLKLTGNAEIFGIMLDDGYGVSVDNIPMRGTSGTLFTNIDRAAMKEMYELSDVAMIILQFGGNSVPGLSGKKSISYYTSRIASQINYFKKINPDIKILFVGPSDMSTRVNGVMATYPLLPDFANAIKDTVTAHGCAFWNMFEAMGGKNSMTTWVENGYASTDHIHFTPKGAKTVGDNIANTLSVFYDLYKYKQSVPTELYSEALYLFLNPADTTSINAAHDTISYDFDKIVPDSIFFKQDTIIYESNSTY